MSRINNYEELVQERKKLEADLMHYGSAIEGEVNAIRRKFEPLTRAVAFFSPSKNGTPNNKLLEVGTNLGIDLFVLPRFLRKAGWLARTILPVVVKTASSKAMALIQAFRR